MPESQDEQEKWFINRELSALEFNHRVLALARDEQLPLLERLKFLFICSSNLDEFFEIRVAGLKQQVAYGSYHRGIDGLTPPEVLTLISSKTHQIVTEIYYVLNNELLPALEKENIRLLTETTWTEPQQRWIAEYFTNEVLPILSPIALDSAHPFPRLVNKSLNFIVRLQGKDAFGRASGLAIVHVPRSIPRVIMAPAELSQAGDTEFFFLTSIIHAHVAQLFPGLAVTGCYQFRVTRNSDLFLEEEEIEDLALAVKSSLYDRRYGRAVRIEIAHDCPEEIANYLLVKQGLAADELYRINGPVNLARFMKILRLIDHSELRYPPFTPGLPATLKRKSSLFAAIRQQDILLHHPYQSFEPVLDLIRQATIDPDVIAIKQTLYRTGAESQMVTALVDAARAGKEVTAVIELRARFDEASNIELATRLQAAGALVVYGVVGYKTHAKMLLIVRRENQQLKRYVHIGTGNYHASTAREYTDIGLLTYNPDIAADVHYLFQQLTGIGKVVETKCLLHSPFTLFNTFISLIEHETAQAKKGKPARIIAKMNSLTDNKIIQALYSASQAGVEIALIIRGICCLRPGIPGISENIRVRSIVGRFLEHSRIFYFYHHGKELLYCGSADWMERNFYYRIEVCFPILDQRLKQQLKENTLDIYLSDTSNCWELQTSGEYEKTSPEALPAFNSQATLLEKLAEIT